MFGDRDGLGLAARCRGLCEDSSVDQQLLGRRRRGWRVFVEIIRVKGIGVDGRETQSGADHLLDPRHGLRTRIVAKTARIDFDLGLRGLNRGGDRSEHRGIGRAGPWDRGPVDDIRLVEQFLDHIRTDLDVMIRHGDGEIPVRGDIHTAHDRPKHGPPRRSGYCSLRP